MKRVLTITAVRFKGAEGPSLWNWRNPGLFGKLGKVTGREKAADSEESFYLLTLFEKVPETNQEIQFEIVNKEKSSGHKVKL